MQQRLVDDYGSDPNAKDISRVLRLPGFDHRKNPAQPHRVRIVDESGEPPLPWETVKAKLPPVVQSVKAPDGRLPDPGTPLTELAEIASALAVLDPDLPYQGWLNVGMALHSTGAGQEAFEIWDHWSQGGTSYRPGECLYRWHSFTQGRGITLSTLFHMAQEAGWDGKLTPGADMNPLIEEQGRRMLADFGRRHAVAMLTGKAVIVYRECNAGTGRMTTQFSSPADMRLKHQPEKIPCLKADNGGKPSVEQKPLVDTWLNSPTRHTYDQVVFKPIAGLVAGNTALPEGQVLNLYQGLAIQPQAGDCQPILNHIREVWCSGNESAFTYVLGWLARMFQRPDERGHTVIVLKSGEGTGKNIIIDILVSAFGEHATVAVKTEDLTGRFNDHLGTSVLVFANEATWGGDKSMEGTLKSLITDTELPVERKYLPKYRVPNCCHLIMASNNDWVAPVGLDDRRYLILDVSEARKGDRTYFKALADHIDGGGAAAFIDHLLNRELAGFDPRVMPDLGLDQAAKRDAKIRGADSITQWWIHCLVTGEILSPGAPGVGLSVTLSPKWDQGPITVTKQVLYDAYRQWTTDNRRHCEHLGSMTTKLKTLVDLVEGRQAASVDPRRPRAYTLPTLSDCRHSFEVKTKMPWGWGDEYDLDAVDLDEVEEHTMLPGFMQSVSQGRVPRGREGAYTR